MPESTPIYGTCWVCTSELAAPATVYWIGGLRYCAACAGKVAKAAAADVDRAEIDALRAENEKLRAVALAAEGTVRAWWNPGASVDAAISLLRDAVHAWRETEHKSDPQEKG